MMYLLILSICCVMFFMAYMLGKKDEKLNESFKDNEDIYSAMDIRCNSDIIGLRKKYKRNSL